MSKSENLLERLDQASAMERKLLDYGKRAAEESRTPSRRHVMELLVAHHQTHLERLHARREALHRERKLHFLSDAVESLSDALSGVVAGLPVEFIEEETNPSIAMLIRMEERLLDHYEKTLPLADEETRVLIESAIDSIRRHVEQLHEVDPLS